MTQVISCQRSIAEICSETIASCDARSGGPSCTYHGRFILSRTDAFVVRLEGCRSGFGIPVGCGARFLSRPSYQRCRGSLISPRVQPARYGKLMGFPRPVTQTSAPPLETPAPCHVRLAATTLKPCENFAKYRIRLSFPYILRSTPLPGCLAQQEKSTPHAKGFCEELPSVRTLEKPD
jgi:hypothetical protein